MDLAFLDHRQQRTGQTYSQTLWTLRAQAISAPEDLPNFLSGRNFPAVSEKNGGIPCNRVRSIYKCPNDFFSGLIRFLRHRRGIMFSHCLPRCMSRAKIGSTIGQPRQPRQHAVRAGKYIPVPTWTHPQAASPLPCKNGIVRTAGKSIIQMRLHQITAGGLQIVSRKQRGSKAERKWLGVPIRFHSHSHIAYVTFVFAVKLHKLKKYA